MSEPDGATWEPVEIQPMTPNTAIAIHHHRHNSGAACIACEVVNLRTRLAALEQLIGYLPTMSCCKDAVEHLGHLKARSERVAVAEAALVNLSPSLANDPHPTTLEEKIATVNAEYKTLIQGHVDMEAALGVADEMEKYLYSLSNDHADDLAARFHAAREKCK